MQEKTSAQKPNNNRSNNKTKTTRGEKNMFSDCPLCTQAFSPDYVIFMDSRGCAVQYLGITLNIFPLLICFTISAHVALWVLSNRAQMMSKHSENKKVTH